MVKSIFVTHPFKEKMFDIVRSHVPEGLSVVVAETDAQEECIEKIRDADYLLAGHAVRVDAALLDAGNKLKMVQRLGVGLDNVDRAAMIKRGIPLYVNRGVNSRSVAELTLTLMLGLLRRLPMLDAGIRVFDWDRNECSRHEIHGKTIGLIGFGSIGSLVSEMLRPFGVKILYFKPNRLPEEDEAKYDVSYRRLDDLLGESDIISLHCMMNDENRGMMNRETFAKMRDGAWLINTSRGALINDSDFADAILSGKLSGAALDVFCVEPLPDDSLLRSLPNVILTPHAGVTQEAFMRIITEGMGNIGKFDRGELEAIAERRLV